MPASSALHILRTIKDRASVSRTDLQRITGLSWGTITNTTRELLARRLIREVGALSTKAGRKPMRLALDAGGHALIGLHISPAGAECLLINLAGDILWREKTAFGPDEPAGAALARAGALAMRARAAGGERTLLGIGASFPGVVNVKSGRVYGCSSGWGNVAAREILESRLHLPVCLEQQVNCLALAERWFGAAGAGEDVLCIHLGETVGLGILIGGDVFRGSTGHAANFAHLVLDPQGPACVCGGRGCVEAYCASGALLAYAHHAADNGHRHPARSIEELAALAGGGDAAARAAFARMGEQLGRAAAHLIKLFDPAVVVLAGRSTAGTAFYQEAMEREIAAHTKGAAPGEIAGGTESDAHGRLDIGQSRAPAALVISRLGEDAAAMGACGVILQRVFDHGAASRPEPMPAEVAASSGPEHEMTASP